MERPVRPVTHNLELHHDGPGAERYESRGYAACWCSTTLSGSAARRRPPRGHRLEMVALASYRQSMARREPVSIPEQLMTTDLDGHEGPVAEFYHCARRFSIE